MPLFWGQALKNDLASSNNDENGNIQKITFPRHLPCARDSDFMPVILFNVQISPIKQVLLLLPFYRGGQ
jgi:hypothetical protein